MTEQEISTGEEAKLAGAFALLTKRNHAAAMVLLEDFLADHPRHQLGLCVSLQVLMGLGRYQEAYDRAVRIEDVEYVVWRMMAETDALIALGRNEEARERARHWEATKPGTVGPVIRLARVALITGDAATALAEAERALRLDPKNVHVLILIARAHIARGKARAARSTLSKALKLEPGQVEARALWERVRLGTWEA